MIQSDLHLAKQAEAAVYSSLMVFERSGAFGGRVALEKGKDIKLYADLLLSRELCSCLNRLTGIRTISEEDEETHQFPENETVWIVDPLDGSMNYSCGIPLYCISVALWRGGDPVIGIIYDMERKRMFTTFNDQAWGDCKTISVSAVGDLAQAVLATGFPLLMDTSSESMTLFMNFTQCFKKVRMLGTAALSLAWVADGRLDAYYERDIMLWDVAAGVALVRAAGGCCFIRPGRHPMSLEILAANSELAEKMKGFLAW